MEWDSLPHNKGEVVAETEVVTDDSLHDKTVIFLSHSTWVADGSGGRVSHGRASHFFHADKPHERTPATDAHHVQSVKMRWMKGALEKVLTKEGVDEDTAFICLDSLFIDQENANTESSNWILALLARCSCLVVFATDKEGQPSHVLERAWLRRSIFAFRLMSAVGIYTATYVTKLEDLSSLAGLSVEAIAEETINPKKYLRDIKEATSDDFGDNLCPFSGKVSEESQRVLVKRQCEELLKKAILMPPEKDLRQRIIHKPNRPSYASRGTSSASMDSTMADDEEVYGPG